MMFYVILPQLTFTTHTGLNRAGRKEFKEQITDRGKIVKFRNNLDFGRLEICQLEELHLRLLAMCMMKTEGRLPQNLQSNFDPSRSSFHDHN